MEKNQSSYYIIYSQPIEKYCLLQKESRDVLVNGYSHKNPEPYLKIVLVSKTEKEGVLWTTKVKASFCHCIDNYRTASGLKHKLKYKSKYRFKTDVSDKIYSVNRYETKTRSYRYTCFNN